GGTLDIGANSRSVGSVTITGGNIVGTTGVLTANTTYDVQGGTIAAIISGAVGLTKGGATNSTATLTGTNSYTGVTRLSARTSTILSLANGGSVSAIGASTAAASNLVLDGGATLAYGTAGLSAVTDRGLT